jgi:hypothetical protein
VFIAIFHLLQVTRFVSSRINVCDVLVRHMKLKFFPSTKKKKNVFFVLIDFETEGVQTKQKERIEKKQQPK